MNAEEDHILQQGYIVTSEPTPRTLRVLRDCGSRAVKGENSEKVLLLFSWPYMLVFLSPVGPVNLLGFT